MQKNKGFVWAVILVVVALVLLFVWNKQKASAPTGDDMATTTPVAGDTDTTTTAPSTGTPKPATTVTTPKATTQATPSKTTSGAYIVSYGSGGFSPANITISPRSSIHFVNNSSASMSIAPADSVNQPYATLNQNKSVGKGGTYDFTFTVKGVYGYYNRNNTKHTGIIVVQ